MKFNAIKLALSATALLAASGFAMQAQAHCLTQSITAGATATQDDVYLINCPTGTHSVYGRVALVSGAAVTYQLGAAGGSTQTTSDSTTSASATCRTAGQDGVNYEHLNPAGTPSAYVSYTAVPGVNTLAVTKNSASTANYGIEFHCMSGSAGQTSPSNVAAGTEIGGNYELSTVVDALDSGSDTNLDANLPINH